MPVKISVGYNLLTRNKYKWLDNESRIAKSYLSDAHDIKFLRWGCKGRS